MAKRCSGDCGVPSAEATAPASSSSGTNRAEPPAKQTISCPPPTAQPSLIRARAGHWFVGMAVETLELKRQSRKRSPKSSGGSD